jgi:PncC family amidohydrolase
MNWPRKWASPCAPESRTLAIAESCTGGWIAKVITDVPGSSGWFDRGFVTYSNAAKTESAWRPVSDDCHSMAQ